MRPLGTGLGHRRIFWRGRTIGLHLYLHPLATHQGHTGASLGAGAPVPPEERRRGDGQRMRGARSPDAAFGCSFPATDRVLAADKGDNPESWRHRGRAASHRVLGAVRSEQAPCRQGNTASHRVGGESPDQRSDRVSRAGLRLSEHIPARGRLAWEPPQGQEQARWCARGQAGGGGPVPAADSTPIG